jgi:predicted transcriptional regulator
VSTSCLTSDGARSVRARRVNADIRSCAFSAYNPSRLTGELAVSDAPKAIELTTQIIASYVGKNPIAVGDLPALIRAVYTAMDAGGETEAEPTPVALSRAEIRKSATPDGIRSFEDGKVYKSLKRHLSKKGLTPAGYRAKWGLPAEYKMVSEAYSAQRSALAKAVGLGRRAAAKAPEPATAAPPAKASRKKRAAKPS